MLNSNTWNHFPVYKQMINIIEKYYCLIEIIENICVKTIAILLCEQISSNSFENKITHELFTYKSLMYNHLTVCKQMTDVKING